MSDEAARSQSRGREVYVSSGRGGAGNIHRASKSREPVKADEFSPTRGRELDVDSTKVHSSGRGGAGNIRSPSTGPAITVNQAEVDYEREVIQRNIESEKTAVHSSGRGGAGNISRSRSRGPSGGASGIFGRVASRSRSPGPAVHSTGRGGAGNIKPGDAAAAAAADTQDYEERKQHSHASGVHSTGRGGAGNLTEAPAPPVEHHGHQSGGMESSGRGGAGNIHGENLPGLLAKAHIKD